MASLVSSRHPTQFFVDLNHAFGEKSSLKDFLVNEAHYDKVMFQVFKILGQQRFSSLDSSSSFLALMDKIQAISTAHAESATIPEGRASLRNGFCVVSHHTSDSKGVEDLIRKIWIDQEEFNLEVVHPIEPIQYNLTPKYFSTTTQGKLTSYTPQKDHAETSVAPIIGTLVPLVQECLTRFLPEQFKLYNERSKETREERVKLYIDKFLVEIKAQNSDKKKIVCISLLMRDLLQMHLYYKGNGRTIYLLANLLMMQNQLPPFYPRNLCVFNANSSHKMLTEVLEGQKRFVEFFISFENLDQNLEDFYLKLEKLEQLLQELPEPGTLLQLCHDRNFTTLFKATVIKKEFFNAFEYLLKNKNTFNIDKSAEYSIKQAQLLARNYKNQKALRLLANA